MCEQLAHLLGASGVHHVTAVDLGEPTDGLVFDREDAVAAATQFFGEGCADAGVVGEDEPGRIHRPRSRVRRAPSSHRTRAPLNLEQSLVDALGRHARRGAQRLHREAVEDGERLPGAVGDRDVALDLLAGRRHDADVNPHVLFGCAVDGAVADPGRQVRVLVLLLPEKWCAEQRLEGAVDERRMESEIDRVRRRSQLER